MIEAMLVVIILAVLAFHAFTERQHQEERGKLVNALMSRNALEFRDLELTAKVQPIVPPTTPDFVAESDLDNDEFFESIKETS